MLRSVFYKAVIKVLITETAVYIIPGAARTAYIPQLSAISIIDIGYRSGWDSINL